MATKKPGKTLLTGKAYTPSEETDIRATWAAHGWKPACKAQPRSNAATYTQPRGKTA